MDLARQLPEAIIIELKAKYPNTVRYDINDSGYIARLRCEQNGSFKWQIFFMADRCRITHLGMNRRSNGSEYMINENFIYSDPAFPFNLYEYIDNFVRCVRD